MSSRTELFSLFLHLNPFPRSHQRCLRNVERTVFDALKHHGGFAFPTQVRLPVSISIREDILFICLLLRGNLMAWGASLRGVGVNQFKDLGTGTITFEAQTVA